MPERHPFRQSTATPCPVLVLGVGNILLRDEGVGVRVVQAMEGMGLPPGVELFDGATAGFDLVDALADREKVIVIDAADGDFDPGTVLRLTPDDLAPQKNQRASLHEVGLMETLTAARRLGVAPREVVIIGVKPKHAEWGLELSPEIADLIPAIIELVLAELQSKPLADGRDTSLTGVQKRIQAGGRCQGSVFPRTARPSREMQS
jgi:hydrogenase maturation protease